MRIISGNWKGHRLKTVKGSKTRPTSDKVKGAIFNILGDKVLEARVLDLFAGTGNLSWEALSRGAAGAVLIEKNTDAWNTAVENKTMLGAESMANVLKMDVFSFLSKNDQERFDLIFLDPPYRQGLVDKALSTVKDLSLLKLNGVIIAETASTEKIEDNLIPLRLMLTKKYGDTKIWFLQEAKE